MSCHHKTNGILDDYPAELEMFENNIDRAVKALLFSITSGMAKRIVSNASSAHKALSDLKRNYGQTSQFDVHRERLKMMNMKQEKSLERYQEIYSIQNIPFIKLLRMA